MPLVTVTSLFFFGFPKICPCFATTLQVKGSSAKADFCQTLDIDAPACSEVYVATGGGPGNATAVPGIQIYILAFSQRQIGLASALAVMLMLLVIVVILPIQRLSRENPS